ncbi:MAG: PAS domain-containing protein [Usitatibacter sp.]
MFEQAPFSVQLLAVDGRTLQVNRAWEALWQVSDGDGVKKYVLEEYNILSDPQLEAKGVAPILRQAFAGVSVTIPPIIYDPAELGRAGRARWIVAHAHPVKDEAGRVLEVVLIHDDVTERVQNQNALRASEMRLKQLANTIPQLAWMAEPDGAIHWYNDRWYEYTGETPATMEGWGWQRVHDPVALPKVLEAWKHSIATGKPFQMTFPLRGKDGKFRPFFTLIAPLKDAEGEVVQWFGTNTDVSSLEETEAELRKTEERLRLATDAGNIGIWEWDLVADKVTWSDRVYQLHGLAQGEFGGRAEHFSALVHPEDVDGVWQKIRAAIAAADGFSAEFRAVLPDGGTRWLTTWARVHRDASGSADRLVGALISVDDYKRAEEALRVSDRRKDEFLAMLAHELRNPLAPITTAAHLLALPASDERRIRLAGEIIARQAKHMTELVDDLLDVSRVTRGLVQLKKEVLELKSVIGSAIEQVRPLIEARHHVLTTWTGPEQVSVLGDRTRLIQVLVNLLNNAAKYTPERGKIALKMETRDAHVKISIKDNGLGIDASLIEHVFELFTQGSRTPDRAQGGLGIGLALVKSIATLHDGQVDVYSDGPGKGSIFTLSLPVVRPEAADSPRHENETAPGTVARAVRVMIVDDNLDAAQSLAVLLESDGHHVTVRESARSALGDSSSQPPEVFILDIGMPGLDGYELARQLRKHPAAAGAVFIALTGYGHAHDRALSEAAGFDHHLVKPVDMRELARILARVS